jgi:hypothetical protein
MAEIKTILMLIMIILFLSIIFINEKRDKVEILYPQIHTQL